MFSVIVATRNRARNLPRLLGSVDRAADNHVVELIMVDNGSSDATRQVIEQFCPKNIKIEYIYQPIAGVCKSKNIGIYAARFEILVFTDDDCEIDSRFFSNLSVFHNEHSAPFIVGGRVELGDRSDAPITIKTDLAPDRFGLSSHAFPGGFAHGCNLSMTRNVTLLSGFWDERFGPGAEFRAAEDTEMIYRAHKHNIPIFYDPALLVHHYHGRKTKNDVRALNESYHYGNGAFILKHLDIRLLLNFYWTIRNWAFEYMGGGKFDNELSLSHGDLVVPQIRGALAFLKHKFSRIWSHH